MTTTDSHRTPTASVARALRDAMTDQLLTDGKITSPRVEYAFRTVPREQFVPAGTTLEAAYDAYQAVVTKTSENGAAISSVSAPFIQARMIEQAELRPGMSVLEVGSGGYNAALLAEVVGPEGRVVTVDIDAEVTDRASFLLDATGYGGRVTVTLADAEQGAPEFAPFDAVIVTVGAWDIPPAWWKQLTDGGRLVVPLRMNGITRAIAFRCEAGHLVSTSAEVAGFVAMQGAGARHESALPLTDAQGRRVELRFDEGAPENPHQLDGVLATEPAEVWSGATIGHGVSFADLHLWFACFLPGFCRITAENDVLALSTGRWFPFGAVRDDSLAYLAVRPAAGGTGSEFGARAYGCHAEVAAAVMVERIRAWDRQARRGPAPTFAFWPTGSDELDLPDGVAVMEKAHGLVAISWPATEQRST
ncbi:methyltransferase, FxLD system [Actinoallomurus soli]|uniref:methyltransferase, FxLD system n=1 Tax=Actinoallomurus soli TaxID=2952535 RepID=UPI0027E314EE|nr:methyltransferase, FxLD system [Actinoallomurus soli]